MAVGDTTTSQLSDSLNTIVASARSTREYGGVIPQLVDTTTLDPGTGTSWKEILFAQLSAMAITEATRNDNPQAYVDSAITITPQMVQISTFVTDKARRNVSPKSLAQMGALPGEALVRKEDEDGLTAMDASTQMGATGTPIQTGDVAAARYIISSNATEPGPMPYFGVFHGFVIKDMYDELVAGIGTYPIPEGATAQVFKTGFTLPIATVSIVEDGNITIDGTPDAKGFVASKMAWVLVREMALKTETKRQPGWGGGGDQLFMTASYAYGQRGGGNWSREIIADATAPA
tara:strand:+ start:2757 stop:3626 length:870 start_codon:yes stop_codon:yes gene_type:complete